MENEKKIDAFEISDDCLDEVSGGGMMNLFGKKEKCPYCNKDFKPEEIASHKLSCDSRKLFC